MGVDEFVAELGEEEFGVLFAHLMEVFADLGVQAYAGVVVDGELLLVGVLAVDCHPPPI